MFWLRFRELYMLDYNYGNNYTKKWFDYYLCIKDNKLRRLICDYNRWTIHITNKGIWDNN